MAYPTKAKSQDPGTGSWQTRISFRSRFPVLFVCQIWNYVVLRCLADTAFEAEIGLITPLRTMGFVSIALQGYGEVFAPYVPVSQLLLNISHHAILDTALVCWQSASGSRAFDVFVLGILPSVLLRALDDDIHWNWDHIASYCPEQCISKII